MNKENEKCARGTQGFIWLFIFDFPDEKNNLLKSAMILC